MITARIEWHPEVPSDLRAQLETYVQRHAHLLPRWVHVCVIGWDATGKGSMSSRVDYEYRTGTVWFHGGWWLQTEADRNLAVAHEFVHFALDNMHQNGLRLIELAGADERFTRHLREELRLALEQTVVDLTDMLATAAPVVWTPFPPGQVEQL